MKVKGEYVIRCALCGGLPMLVVGVGGVSYCECMRCHHKSQELETGSDINAAGDAAIEDWNVQMQHRRQ